VKTGVPGAVLLNMAVYDVETVVVGAGHAGLAASWALADRGVEHVVLEEGRIGQTWRTDRWDSFRLNTTRWMSRLPGHAVADADGFFGAGSQTTAAFVDQVATVREELAATGRDPSGFRIAKRVYVTIDDDAARARTRMGEALDRVYRNFGLRDMAVVSVTGPASAVVAGVQEVIDAGAELVMFNPLFDDLEQMERVAAEVIPALR